MTKLNQSSTEDDVKETQIKSLNVSVFKTNFNSFEIKYPFNTDIIELCTETPGRRFCDNKNWSFPI